MYSRSIGQSTHFLMGTETMPPPHTRSPFSLNPLAFCSTPSLLLTYGVDSIEKMWYSFKHNRGINE